MKILSTLAMVSMLLLSGCSFVDVDVKGTEIGHHYATTLEHWRAAFFEHVDAIQKMGFDDKFCRMWEFYLSYCEAGFRERTIGTGHFVFAKPLHVMA